jgi:hypothetical protein
MENIELLQLLLSVHFESRIIFSNGTQKYNKNKNILKQLYRFKLVFTKSFRRFLDEIPS